MILAGSLRYDITANLDPLRRSMVQVQAAAQTAARSFSPAFQNAANDAARAAQKMERSFTGAFARIRSNLLAIVGIHLGAQQITEWADAWTRAGARLASALPPDADINRVRNLLADMAVETRAGLEPLVLLFSRLTHASKDLGLSQQDVADVTRTLAMAMQVSGASTSEVNSVLLQFTQGMSAGVVQGEEFRALMENSIPLQKALAKEFNTNAVGLRKLSEEGKLASDRVARAVLRAFPEISAQFQRMPQTIGQAFNNLGTRITQYIGQADQATGASAKFVSAINWVAENLDVVARTATVAGAALAAAFTGGAIQGLARIAALLNPWVRLGSLIAAASAAIVVFGRDIQPIEGSFATLGDLGRAAFEEVKAAAASAVEVIASLGAQTTAALASIDSRTVFQELLQGVKEAANGFIGAFRFVAVSVPKLLGMIPNAVKDIVITAMNEMVEAVESALGRIAGAVNSVIRGINQIGTSIPEIPAPNLGRFTNEVKGAARETRQAWLDEWEDSDKDFVGPAVDAAVDRVRRTAEAMAAARRVATAFEVFQPAGFDTKTPPSGPRVPTDEEIRRAKKFEAAIKDANERLEDMAAAARLAGASTREIETAKARMDLYREATDAGRQVTGDLKRQLDELAEKIGAAAAQKEWNQALAESRDRLRDIGNEMDLVGLSGATLEIARERQRLWNEAIKAGVEVNDKLRASIEAQATVIGRSQAVLDQAKAAWDSFTSTLNSLADTGINAMMDAMMGKFRGWKELLEDIARTVIPALIKQLIQMLAIQAAARFFGGAPMPNTYGGVGAQPGLPTYGGPRQHGGPVVAGRRYLIGERGPEMFVPRVPGMVLPNTKDVSSVAPRLSANVNVHNYGGGEVETRQTVQGGVPTFDIFVGKVKDAIGRGKMDDVLGARFGTRRKFNRG